MSVEVIQNELGILNLDIARYKELSGKSDQDVMLKQGGKFASNLSALLLKFMPGKGVVTTERLEALKRGEGVYVRPTVRTAVFAKHGARTQLNLTNGYLEPGAGAQTVFGKKGVRKDGKGRNLQALAVARELAVRESGGGFMSYSARVGATKFGSLPGLKPGAKKLHLDRYRRYLGEVGFFVSQDNATLTFSWGQGSTRSDRVAKLLKEPRFHAEVAEAIRRTSADIRAYVPGRMAQFRKQAGLRGA